MIAADQTQDRLREFWTKMSLDLFNNVKELYDQIDTQYSQRTGDEGMGGQMAVRSRGG